jgi:hypothetical protein
VSGKYSTISFFGKNRLFTCFFVEEKIDAVADIDRNPNGERELPVETRVMPFPPLPILPSCLRARINQKNHASLALFSSVGFVVVRLVEVFSEVEMKWAGPKTRVSDVFGSDSTS